MRISSTAAWASPSRLNSSVSSSSPASSALTGATASASISWAVWSSSSSLRAAMSRVFASRVRMVSFSSSPWGRAAGSISGSPAGSSCSSGSGAASSSVWGSSPGRSADAASPSCCTTMAWVGSSCANVTTGKAPATAATANTVLSSIASPFFPLFSMIVFSLVCNIPAPAQTQAERALTRPGRAGFCAHCARLKQSNNTAFHRVFQ